MPNINLCLLHMYTWAKKKTHTHTHARNVFKEYAIWGEREVIDTYILINIKVQVTFKFSPCIDLLGLCKTISPIL